MSVRVAMVAEVRRLVDLPLAEHGGDRSGEEEEQGDIVTLPTRGNDPGYTRRRLRRDRPDPYERVPVGTGSFGNSSFTRARASELPIEPVHTGTEAAST